MTVKFTSFFFSFFFKPICCAENNSQDECTCIEVLEIGFYYRLFGERDTNKWRNESQGTGTSNSTT